MSIPLRWRLQDAETRAVLTECTDIDGLFVDRVFPAEPLRERCTLVSCAPAGPLLAAIDGTGPDWLGSVALEGVHSADRPAGERCFETAEELLDVRVVGHRPAGDGLFDVDLYGHRRDDYNNAGGTVAPEVAGYRVYAADGVHEEAWLGECREVLGLFHERPDPWPPSRPSSLLGCSSEFSGSFDATLAHVRVDGTVHAIGGGLLVYGTAGAARPSALGDGLVDISLNARCSSPMAAVERPIWDLWRAGGPTEPNQWAGLDRSGRYLWVRAALKHRILAPDKPEGTVYHLDGRYVTDYDAFYCAIGEAINGPGGWFGGDLFWLHESAIGDAGATYGFRLIWHDSEVARTHLVAGYDRKSWSAAVTFDDLVHRLTEDGVQVELR